MHAWRKHLARLLTIVSAASMLCIVSCKSDSGSGEAGASDTNGVNSDRISRTDAQQWLASEIELTSSKIYSDPVYTIELDVVFTNRETGTTIQMPGFWNGERNWTVRFALTETGEWDYKTICSDTENDGLHDKQGSVTVKEYGGELDIYKRGFLRTISGTRYFVYNDGTPFFYLGDTHWTLPLEEIDGLGGISEEYAGKYGITSQFKHIMDYRADQGYTVIQSQQLGWYKGVAGNSWMGDLSGSIFDYGVNGEILEQFQKLDKYFAYIADKGFVHAHSQFSYPEELIESYFQDSVTDDQINMLCRYWVARYAAYPVMWTTAQEADKDYYEWAGCTPENNPWLKVMECIAKYDPYDHPMTCHQENTGITRVNDSAFGPKKEHNWYAAQYTTKLTGNVKWKIVKEYYENPGAKPVVNYEGKYDHFWTGSFGARSQGWLAFLNGMFGHGYGVQPIWSISWAEYGEQSPTSDESGEEYERDWNWVEGLYAEGGQQPIYMKNLLEKYEWWNLVPCFNGSEHYTPGEGGYSVATCANNLYIAYLYADRTGNFGSFQGMKNSPYSSYWFDCRTGEASDKTTVNASNGALTIPNKPDGRDWVYVAECIK